MCLVGRAFLTASTSTNQTDLFYQSLALSIVGHGVSGIGFQPVVARIDRLEAYPTTLASICHIASREELKLANRLKGILIVLDLRSCRGFGPADCDDVKTRGTLRQTMPLQESDRRFG